MPLTIDMFASCTVRQGCATVGDSAAFALAAGSGAAALQTVSFQCCARLGNAGLAALVRSCAHLRHVTLKNTLVTEELCVTLQLERPDVRLVQLGGERVLRLAAAAAAAAAPSPAST